MWPIIFLSVQKYDILGWRRGVGREKEELLNYINHFGLRPVDRLFILSSNRGF